MKKFTLVAAAIALFGGTARAQFATPRMKAGAAGTIVTPSAPYWWFAGTIAGDVTCAYDAASASDKCTFLGGSSATLQTAYNASAGANPSILLTAGNGPVSIRAPGAAMGNLFRVEQTGAGADLLTITDNGAFSLTSPQTQAGGSAFIFNTVNNYTGNLTATAPYKFQVNGNSAIEFFGDSSNPLSGVLFRNVNTGAALGAFYATTAAVNFRQGGADIFQATGTGFNLLGGINFTATAGAGAVSLGAMTGDFTFPTGSLSWTGAAAKTASLVGASTFTITGGATSTWSLTAGQLNISGVGLSLQSSGVEFIGLETFSGNVIDFSKNIRLRQGNFSLIAGTQVFDWSNSTGAFKTSTGAVTIGGGTGDVLLNAQAAGNAMQFQIASTTILDIGFTSSNSVSVAANKNLKGFAGTQLNFTGADAIGTAQTKLWFLANTTAAANNAQQFSPAFILDGQGWDASVPANTEAGALLQSQAIQQAGAAPAVTLALYGSVGSTVSKKTMLDLGQYATASLPATCNDGAIAWDTTSTQVKFCKSNAWTAFESASDFNFSAFNSLTSTALIAPLQQTTVTNAATIRDSKFTVEVAGVGAGNYVEKLCSDGATCGAGNVYVTCTSACANAAGTVTTCTLNITTVPAATTLSWSGTTACATNNPAFNVNAHFTNP